MKVGYYIDQFGDLSQIKIVREVDGNPYSDSVSYYDPDLFRWCKRHHRLDLEDISGWNPISEDVARKHLIKMELKR